MLDRFHELNAFIAVVEAGGFSAAARTTGDSQSAISKAIGAMEKRLGVMLFNRSTRRVTLTDQGRRFLAMAPAAWRRTSAPSGPKRRL